ncbi:hypothetical protein CDAR_206551 [Caerostris darwini]|uniref:Uncharacterized protein n=1 Tax=Caerostris darwini TaxID=1538125 RepID=A0AAV4SBG3_9ARAC|nr:hypothetical protein CDAR_206551 [Caerostris darwini]
MSESPITHKRHFKENIQEDPNSAIPERMDPYAWPLRSPDLFLIDTQKSRVPDPYTSDKILVAREVE